MKCSSLKLLAISLTTSRGVLATNSACLNLPRAFVFDSDSWPEFSDALKNKSLYIAFTGLKDNALEYESKVAVDGSIQKGHWLIEAGSSNCEFNVIKASSELLVDDGAASLGKRTWLSLLNGGVKCFKIEEKGMETISHTDSGRKLRWSSTQVWTNPNFNGIKLTIDNDDF